MSASELTEGHAIYSHVKDVTAKQRGGGGDICVLNVDMDGCIDLHMRS